MISARKSNDEKRNAPLVIVAFRGENAVAHLMICESLSFTSWREIALPDCRSLDEQHRWIRMWSDHHG
jgi:hypothetical protein